LKYVELHARSAFSFLEGASSPEQLAQTCAEQSLPAIALLDRDGLYGAPGLHFAAKLHGIRAHVGAEVTLANSRLKGVRRDTRYALLVESREGYRNLCRLITNYKFREKKKEEGFTTPEEVREHAGGLICLTGGPEGPLAAALQKGGIDEGKQEIERLVSIFGHENVFVELQRHFDRGEEHQNRVALEIATHLKLPVIATNGVCYAKPHQRELADVFTCLHNGRRLDTAGKLLGHNSERYLRSPQQMQEIFRDLPTAVHNTVDLSNRLQFTMENLGYSFPTCPVPPGETEASFLRKVVAQGMNERYRHDPALHEKAACQIERELNLIEKLGFCGYFLINRGIERFCRQHRIAAQIRGSAANSATCFALHFTDVDPIARNLLFERFLSESRGEWPDIDWDIESGEERERVIQHMYELYGRHGAAMTANVITFRERSAAREIGKVLGMTEEMVARLRPFLTHWEWKGATDTIENAFQRAGLDLAHPLVSKYLNLCSDAMDLPRHLGQHSGGIIICQGQLSSIMPLEPATMPGRTVAQWDKDYCSLLGIVKIDLLGLGMLKAIKKAREMIYVHYGEPLDPASLPNDDPQVFTTLQTADTIGVFQVESRAQISFLPRLFPRTRYDLAISIGSIRPGPLQGNAVSPLIRRRQGLEPVTYLHPLLKDILERTYGVILFQEQALRVLMVICGFSAAAAEEARRAMSHKRSAELMAPILKRARLGMQSKGIGIEAQERIVAAIEGFLGYAFPESHALAFEQISYLSTYIKCHYPAAFYAGLLNAQPCGFYSPAVLVKDAQRHNVKVRTADILRSEWECTLEYEQTGPVVRIGFNYIRSMRMASANAIVHARNARPFATIADLTRRVPVLRRDELENLAACGALNPIDPRKELHRRDALWQITKFSRPSGPLLDEIRDDETCPLPALSPEQRLIMDYEVLGLTTGKHPMAYARKTLDNRKIKTAQQTKSSISGAFVAMAGEVIASQRPGTASGVMFITLLDETGSCDVVIMPDVYERYRIVIKSSKFLLVEGLLQKVENAREKGAYSISVKARRVSSLSAV
jgi:error-prone DNA polymerase